MLYLNRHYGRFFIAVSVLFFSSVSVYIYSLLGVKSQTLTFLSLFQSWPKRSSQKIRQSVNCPQKWAIAEARLRNSSITLSLENARNSFMEDAVAIKTTLSQRRNARSNAKELRFRWTADIHAWFLHFGDVFFNFLYHRVRPYPANPDKCYPRRLGAQKKNRRKWAKKKAKTPPKKRKAGPALLYVDIAN